VSRLARALAASTLTLVLVPLSTVTARATTEQPTDGPLVVDAGGGATVVVEQSPFHLSVTDAAGHDVLSEVAHADPDTIPEPATDDPISPGVDNQDTTTLYSPLSFMVGAEALTQRTDGEWIGNLESGTRSGTWYSAQDVQSVAQDGSDLVLTLSTNDPSGRVLTVRVGAQGTRAVRVRVQAVPSDGVALIGDSFAASAADGFFGFGGRHDRLDQRGRVLSASSTRRTSTRPRARTRTPRRTR
jgi:sulfoquinovosidase